MKACPNCQASYPLNYTHCPRDGSALIDAGSWQEGTVVRGKYRILSKLGEGGMAVVYKAMHTRFEELRALKVMNAELAHDHDFVKRFLQEAVLTRKIQHPNAVRVEDIDEAEDGRPFMVMEFLDGHGLKDVIEAEAPMAPARVSLIARQVAGALHAAHRLGVVHRDVKPANIVLLAPSRLPGAYPEESEGEEQAKVLDFGIAKAKETRLEGQTTLTRTGNVIGTPTYMSPEQARGMRGADLDGRSDLYSLGIVMYQMLAGGLPFKADTSMQWILAHLQEPPKPFRELRGDLEIPPALAAVVMRCLEKDPARRPPTAEALIDELDKAEAEIAGKRTVSAGTGRTWARETGSSGGRRIKSAAKPAVRLDSSDAGVRSSRRWMAWTAGILAALSIVGALVVWRVQSSIWTGGTTPVSAQNQAQQSATVPPAQPAAPTAAGSASQPTVQPSLPASGAVSSPQAAYQPAPRPAPKTSLPATIAAPATAAPGTAPTAAGLSSVPNDSFSQNLAQGNALRVKGHSQGPPNVAARAPDNSYSRNLAQGHVLQAKDLESQGRFEDALREYQKAAAIDPYDASVKRHIALLNERISKEKDLIR